MPPTPWLHSVLVDTTWNVLEEIPLYVLHVETHFLSCANLPRYKKLEDLLEKSFSLVKMPSLQPVVMCVMKHLPKVRAVKSALAGEVSEPVIHTACLACPMRVIGGGHLSSWKVLWTCPPASSGHLLCITDFPWMSQVETRLSLESEGGSFLGEVCRDSECLYSPAKIWRSITGASVAVAGLYRFCRQLRPLGLC